MKVTRNNKIVLTIFFVVWVLAGISVINYAFAQSPQTGESVDTYRKLRLFTEVFNRIRSNYIDEIDVDTVIDAAIEGMLSELDVHTHFFVPEDFEEFRTDTQGRFGGLGISIDKQGDYITVVSPIEGTPAYDMGILPGDKIIKVDGESVIGIPSNDAVKKMRGDVGTAVNITISRPGIEQELEFRIIRDFIEIKSVPYAFKMDNGVGYIRVRQFNANVSRELRLALDALEEEGIRGLLIDLRFNPGGLLTEAIDTVNEFVGKDKKVVFTKGRIPQVNAEYYTRIDRIRTGYPVVVMINEASASASEIFAGSIQDWDKGLVVGKTSFGKGSVQQLYPLQDGYGLKVTTSKYYIHSGRTIHRDDNDKLLKGEKLSESDKEKYEEERKSKIFYTERGRVVYGGGGITPDIEIEQSTLTPFEIELRRKNLFFPFTTDYLLNNELVVTEDYQVSDEIYNTFIEHARENGIEITDKDLEESGDWIKYSLKTNIITRKLGEQAGNKVGLEQDTQFQEALSLFDKFSTLEEMFEYAESLRE
ncbi:MAG: S41 family peptidase [Candidatus Cloacimonas sp.]|nr:S41 family peptidase [Candidatus Cloacimonadota bacterium]